MQGQLKIKILAYYVQFDLLQQSAEDLQCTVIVVNLLQVAGIYNDLVTHLPTHQEKLLLGRFPALFIPCMAVRIEGHLIFYVFGLLIFLFVDHCG